jgi:hypothetical protein
MNSYKNAWGAEVIIPLPQDMPFTARILVNPSDGYRVIINNVVQCVFKHRIPWSDFSGEVSASSALNVVKKESGDMQQVVSL